MGYAELIQQRLQTLPPEQQAEVYDFVEFIAARGAGVARLGADTLWTDQELTRLSMAQAMRGLEDETADYALSDIKERWQ